MNFVGKGADAKISEEEAKRNLLRLSEISVSIDTYDDIFSDFDSRPYSERAISDDFLQEMKRRSRDKPMGGFELRFLTPHRERNFAHEQLVKRRLKEHFKRHYILLLDEVRKFRKRSGFMIILGIVMMVGAAYLSFLQWSNFFAHLLTIIMEPAGWFTFWTGLDDLYRGNQDTKSDLDFYEKMSQCDIHFLSY